VAIALLLAFICSMVGMGSSLHELDQGGFTTKFLYNKYQGDYGAAVDYKDCKDGGSANPISDLCDQCYSGGSVWITIQVIEFIVCLIVLTLCFFRSMGQQARLNFATPQAQWRTEWRLYIVLTFCFLIANIIWGSTCFQKTIDTVTGSATIRATGYGFSLFMFWFMLIITCVMAGAEQRGPTWLTPFASGAAMQQQPATVVVVASPGAVPVAQPVGAPMGGTPPMGYAVAPAPQYGQPVGQPMAYGQPAYGQPAYGQPQPQYGAPVGQPQYGAPVGQPQYGQPAYGQPQPQYGAPVAQPMGQPMAYGAPVQSSGEV
jgi:hypothetical protein